MKSVGPGGILPAATPATAPVMTLGALQRHPPAPSRPFVADVEAIRTRARADLAQGAVTPSYGADRAEVVAFLNGALATELVCCLRYRRHHFMAQGWHATSCAAEFLAHANEELGHADQLAARIVQLGGEPDFAPAGLVGRSHAEYVAGHDLASMIRENLVAERIAIESYAAMVRHLGSDDSTTRRLLESILATEEEHAEDMATLLGQHRPAEA